jgi:hypothetical protein
MEVKRIPALLALLGLLVLLAIPLTAGAGNCTPDDPDCTDERYRRPAPPTATPTTDRQTRLEERLDPILPPTPTPTPASPINLPPTDVPSSAPTAASPTAAQESAPPSSQQSRQNEPIFEDSIHFFSETDHAAFVALGGLGPYLDRPFDCFMQLLPKGRASCPTIVPSAYGYYEKAEPEGINWAPWLSISDPHILDFATGELVGATNAAQFRICNGCYGLCGQVAMAAILRTEFPRLTANDVVELYDDLLNDKDPDANYTNAHNLVRLVNRSYFGSYWSAEAEVLSANRLERAGEIRDALQEGYYIISSVEIMLGSSYDAFEDTSGRVGPTLGPEPITHWVVITGISEQWDVDHPDSAFNWVQTYNPFDNQIEYYTWEDFEDAMTGDFEAVMLRVSYDPSLLPCTRSCPEFIEFEEAVPPGDQWKQFVGSHSLD